MTPHEYYDQLASQGNLSEDSKQVAVLEKLGVISLQLIEEENRRTRFFSFLHKPRSVQGMYLWGSVGIGKTLMMDCFFHCLPIQNKLRMHFHAFMQRIHNALTKYQGKKEPLQLIAKDLANEAMVICFDEFFVSDVTDAMLLGRLFKHLFERGVSLIATSNTAPDDLYKYGLQREQFIPAINLIKQQTEVIHLGISVDYRLRHLEEAGVFYTPLDDYARTSMEKTFSVLTQDEVVTTTPVEIAGREIKVIKKAGDTIWFDFQEICSVPRSQKDYLLIAEKYRTVFVSDIPVIGPSDKDKICLFISLIDVFYDANVRVVISAAEPVSQIYSRGFMIMEYTRTNSRLLEMQSSDYFAGEFALRR